MQPFISKLVNFCDILESTGAAAPCPVPSRGEMVAARKNPLHGCSHFWWDPPGFPPDGFPGASQPVPWRNGRDAKKTAASMQPIWWGSE